MRGSGLCIALVALALGSCGPRGLPGIPDSSSFKEVGLKESARFLIAQQQSAGGLRTLKLSADVTVSKGVAKRSFLQSFVYQSPDMARIESFVPAVNQLISLVIVSPEMIFVRDNREGGSYIAEPTPENIARLIHLPLYPADLAHFLTGSGVLHAKLDDIKVFSSGLAGSEILRTVFTRDADQRIEQYFRSCGDTPGEFRLIGLQIFNSESSAEQVSASLKYGEGDFDNSLTVCGIPRAISLRLKHEGLTADISVKNVRQNEPLKPGLFQIPVQ